MKLNNSMNKDIDIEAHLFRYLIYDILALLENELHLK